MLETKNNNIANTEINSRKEKFSNMKAIGFSFPNTFKKKITTKQIYKKYHKKNIYELKKLNIEIAIAGRMIQKRIMGKASF